MRTPVIFSSLLFLGACAVPVYMAGHTDDRAEVVVGTAMIDPMTGGGPAQMVGERSGLRCSGTVVNTQGADGVVYSRAKGTLHCDDGRVLSADMIQTTATGGSGVGHDEYGNTAKFEWDMNKGRIDAVAEQSRRVVQASGMGIDHILRHEPRTASAAPARKTPPPPPPKPASVSQAAASDVLNFPYPRAEVRPDDIAVVIGNRDYRRLGRDIPDVAPAQSDAASFRRFAIEGLGVREGNIIDLRDATGAQLNRVFGTEANPRGQLFDWVRPGRSRVWVYYSGHGAPGEGSDGAYLVPVDADAARIALNGYPLRTLYANLGQLPAVGVTVVMDACFSGFSQAGSVMGKSSGIYLRPVVPTVPPKVTIIAAGAPDQVASWEEDGSHGLFTKYYLEAMSGKADRNGDGQVSLKELQAYLDDTLTYWARRYYGRDQNASIAAGS